jgi:hypothetical protein
LAYAGLMTLRFPVAANADAALQAPLGFAMRETEARALADGAAVAFTVEWVGPVWPDLATAEAAFAKRLAGTGGDWWRLKPVIAPPPGAKLRKPAPVKPTFKGGKRWPILSETERPVTGWRLSIRYWRAGEAAAVRPKGPARRLRRDPAASGLEAEALRLLAEQPLQALLPQRALDIGLFEVHPPDQPYLVIPDE